MDIHGCRHGTSASVCGGPIPQPTRHVIKSAIYTHGPRPSNLQYLYGTVQSSQCTHDRGVLKFGCAGVLKNTPVTEGSHRWREGHTKANTVAAAHETGQQSGAGSRDAMRRPRRSK